MAKNSKGAVINMETSLFKWSYVILYTYFNLFYFRENTHDRANLVKWKRSATLKGMEEDNEWQRIAKVIKIEISQYGKLLSGCTFDEFVLGKETHDLAYLVI